MVGLFHGESTLCMILCGSPTVAVFRPIVCIRSLCFVLCCNGLDASHLLCLQMPASRRPLLSSA